MNNALQMLNMSDLFKTDSMATKQRSAETPGTKSFDSIYQSKTYDSDNQFRNNGGKSRNQTDLNFAGKENNALSAAKNASTERRNLTKPEILESKPVVTDDAQVDKTKVVSDDKVDRTPDSMKKKIKDMKKMLKTMEDTIDQAVQSGMMTQDQANLLKSQLAALEQQLATMATAMSEGTMPSSAGDEVLEKMTSALEKLDNLKKESIKGKVEENTVASGKTSESQQKEKTPEFEKVLAELESTVKEVKALTSEQQKAVAQTQAVEASTVDPTKVVAKQSELVAKDAEVAEVAKDNKSSTSQAKEGVATKTSESTEVKPVQRTDVQTSVQDQTQQQAQSQNGSTVVAKGVVSAEGTGSEDGKGKQTQKVEADVAIKQVDVSKMENTLIKSAKVETPQVMKRLETNIMEQIQNMMQNSVKIVKSGNSEMVIRLKPENLGNVSLKLNMEGGNLSAEFKVENLMVKGMIESNMTDLKNALTEKGYNVSGFDVSLGQNQTNTNSQNGQEHSDRRYQNSGRDFDGNSDNKTGFENEMIRQQLDDRSSVINSLG